MATHSKGSATWAGDLTGGHGTVSIKLETLRRSRPVGGARRQPGQWDEPEPDRRRASCFSMAFARRLAKNGTNAERLDVGHRDLRRQTDAGMRIIVGDRRHGSCAEDRSGDPFAKCQREDNCPVSRALKNNVKLSVSAKLADQIRSISGTDQAVCLGV
jgi:organic hydroperoxide reductase OsmC/OhrA